MRFLLESFSVLKKSVYSIIVLEVLFVSIFIVSVKILSDKPQGSNSITAADTAMNIASIFHVGCAISLALIFAGEAINRIRYVKIKFPFLASDLPRMTRRELFKLEQHFGWLLAASTLLFLGEVLNVWTFALHAPMAERDLLARFFTVLVVFILAFFLYPEKGSKMQKAAIFTSFLPALLVIYQAIQNGNIVKLDYSWIFLTIVMACVLGFKRVIGRKFKDHFSQGDSLRWYGYFTLLMFLAFGLLTNTSLIPTGNEWILLPIIFIVTPLITVSRQAIFDRKLTPIVHDSLAYLGVLIITFMMGNKFYPVDVVLKGWKIALAIILSGLAALMFIYAQRQKRKLEEKLSS